jgi:hypothetical protein
VAGRHRRFAPLNFKSRPTLFYRLRPTSIIEAQAWRHSDDSRLWRNVALTIVVLRSVRGAVGRSAEVAALEPLRPGEKLVLRAIPMKTRAQRKAARRWTPGAG